MTFVNYHVLWFIHSIRLRCWAVSEFDGKWTLKPVEVCYCTYKTQKTGVIYSGAPKINANVYTYNEQSSKRIFFPNSLPPLDRPTFFLVSEIRIANTSRKTSSLQGTAVLEVQQVRSGKNSILNAPDSRTHNKCSDVNFFLETSKYPVGEFQGVSSSLGSLACTARAHDTCVYVARPRSIGTIIWD